MPEISAVTGALGYTGKYIAQRLLSIGQGVVALTGHPDRPNPFGNRVRAAPYSFDNPMELAKSLEGASTLYNTYWVRFPYGGVTFEKAVENSLTLIRAAEAAGVRRIVQISISHASEDSHLAYFRGKGVVERAIMGSGLSYAILRPTVVFGLEDILINNIAWFLRRFPLFPVFGRGDYLLRPVYVEDVADIAVASGQQEGDVIINAVGPEAYTFKELVGLIGQKVGSRARVVALPPRLALLLVKALGYLVRDVVLTREEVQGLVAGLLHVDGPPTGQTKLSDWLEKHANALGTRYASELQRHYRT